MQKIKPSPSDSLRERKRAETYDRIQREAVRLFLDRGFDATTLNNIAGAAGVSRRSLFHYFASKEEIVFSTKADFPDLVAEAVARRPADEPLMDMVENALVDLAERHLSPQARALAKLIHETPALSAGDQAKYEKIEHALAKALADRKSLPTTDIACRVVAATAIGILKLSTETWLRMGGDGPEIFGRAAFAALKAAARS